METPRLLSEYFAARAQSSACISAEADVDVAIKRESAKNSRPLAMWWGAQTASL
jgi:hypothetical protein